jgi:hypothetical protein
LTPKTELRYQSKHSHRSLTTVAVNYVLNAGVTLSAAVTLKVKKIADAYNVATKKTITITSGTRTAASQADAMYGKLVGGDRLTIYRDQVSAKAIKKAYDDGKAAKKAKPAIVKDMTVVIEAQIKNTKFISKHLKAGAVDVRSRDMNTTEKDAFKTAAKGVATSVLLETTPPHFHLQF